MKVIRPVEIGSDQLVSSSVPEDEYLAWDGATAYAVGDRVIFNHSIYESVQASTNKNPADEPLIWARISLTNRWAMFDSEISSKTSASGEIAVVIKPGYINGLAMFGLEGSNVSVTVRDGDGGPVLYSIQKSLDGSIVSDWSQYFFEPIEQREDVVLIGLPQYFNAYISVSITGLEPKCGILVAGSVYDVGRTQRGASVGIRDYSRKDTSATGTTTFTKRRYSKWMRAALLVENATLNKLQNILAGLRATPCVWIGTDTPGYEPLTVFGFYKDFSIDIEYSNHSLCNLEIEGLT